MQPQQNRPDLLTSAEAYQILAVSQATFSRIVTSGELTPAFRHPGKRGAYLFHRADVEALAAARAEKKAS